MCAGKQFFQLKKIIGAMARRPLLFWQKHQNLTLHLVQGKDPSQRIQREDKAKLIIPSFFLAGTPLRQMKLI